MLAKDVVASELRLPEFEISFTVSGYMSLSKSFCFLVYKTELSVIRH